MGAYMGTVKGRSGDEKVTSEPTKNSAMQSIAPLSMDLRDSLAQASLPLRWVLNAISDPFSITFLGGG